MLISDGIIKYFFLIWVQRHIFIDGIVSCVEENKKYTLLLEVWIWAVTTLANWCIVWGNLFKNSWSLDLSLQYFIKNGLRLRVWCNFSRPFFLFHEASSGAKHLVFIIFSTIAQAFNNRLQHRHLVTHSFGNNFRTSLFSWTMHVHAVNRSVVTVHISVRGCQRRWNGICTFNPLLSVFDDVTARGPAAPHTNVQLLVVLLWRWVPDTKTPLFCQHSHMLCSIFFWDVYFFPSLQFY